MSDSYLPKYLKYCILKGREILSTLVVEKDRLLIDNTILNFSNIGSYESRSRFIILKYDFKVIIYALTTRYEIKICNPNMSLYLDYTYKKNNIVYSNYYFNLNENLELNYEDLPKNLYEWSEEEFFYYALKYQNN